jgi:membrane-bound lytic murein transglycosylase A
MDQDTGGAIRAAGRCDVFMGTGPEVGELAGRTLAEGKLYYIFVRPDGAMSDTLASPAVEDMPAPLPAE